MHQLGVLILVPIEKEWQHSNPTGSWSMEMEEGRRGVHQLGVSALVPIGKE